MRILEVISTGYSAGGAQVNVCVIRDELRKRGYEVKVLSSDRKGDGMFSDYQFPSISPSSLFKIFQHLFYFSTYFSMRRLVREFKPDIIHFHNIDAFSPSILFATGKIPTVMTIHSPEEFTLALLPWFLPRTDFKERPFDITNLTPAGRIRYWYYRFIQRPIYLLGLHKVKLFITPSKYMAEAIKSEAPARKIMQIYNGINLPSYEPLPGNKRILYVGRLESVKGVDDLMRAFSKILLEIPDAQLYIVGDGPMRKELEQLSIDLGVAERISFKGWMTSREKITKQYKEATIVVIPSVWPENLPTVCIEALAVGRPVVGTRTGGIPELINDGSTGYIVQPQDDSALSQAIIKIFKDPAQIELMSKDAALSAQRFNIEKFVDQIENAYKKIYEDTHR